MLLKLINLACAPVHTHTVPNECVGWGYDTCAKKLKL